MISIVWSVLLLYFIIDWTNFTLNRLKTLSSMLSFSLVLARFAFFLHFTANFLYEYDRNWWRWCDFFLAIAMWKKMLKKKKQTKRKYEYFFRAFFTRSIRYSCKLRFLDPRCSFHRNFPLHLILLFINLTHIKSYRVHDVGTLIRCGRTVPLGPTTTTKMPETTELWNEYWKLKHIGHNL